MGTEIVRWTAVKYRDMFEFSSEFGQSVVVMTDSFGSKQQFGHDASASTGIEVTNLSTTSTANSFSGFEEGHIVKHVLGSLCRGECIWDIILMLGVLMLGKRFSFLLKGNPMSLKQFVQ